MLAMLSLWWLIEKGAIYKVSDLGGWSCRLCKQNNWSVTQVEVP